MDKQAQIDFIKSITSHHRDKIIGLIESGKIPETFNGGELRQLLIDRITEAQSVSHLSKARKQEYKRVKIERGLA